MGNAAIIKKNNILLQPINAQLLALNRGGMKERGVCPVVGCHRLIIITFKYEEKKSKKHSRHSCNDIMDVKEEKALQTS